MSWSYDIAKTTDKPTNKTCQKLCDLRIFTLAMLALQLPLLTNSPSTILTLSSLVVIVKLVQ